MSLRMCAYNVFVSKMPLPYHRRHPVPAICNCVRCAAVKRTRMARRMSAPGSFSRGQGESPEGAVQSRLDRGFDFNHFDRYMLHWEAKYVRVVGVGFPQLVVPVEISPLRRRMVYQLNSWSFLSKVILTVSNADRRRCRVAAWKVMISISIVVGFLVMKSTEIKAQCMVTNTTASMATTMGSPYTEVMKTLNAAYLCSSIGNMNVSLCAPVGAMIRTMLTASASVGAISPSCMFTCTGGTACAPITIDGSDGLPVELMEFSIEGEGDLT